MLSDHNAIANNNAITCSLNMFLLCKNQQTMEEISVP